MLRQLLEKNNQNITSFSLTLTTHFPFPYIIISSQDFWQQFLMKTWFKSKSDSSFVQLCKVESFEIIWNVLFNPVVEIYLPRQLRFGNPLFPDQNSLATGSSPTFNWIFNSGSSRNQHSTCKQNVVLRHIKSLLLLLTQKILILDFGLIWPIMESTFFHTDGEHDNHYIIEMVNLQGLKLHVPLNFIFSFL